jgi:hypothetical protein
MSVNNTNIDGAFGNDSDSTATDSASDEERQDTYEVGKDWLRLVRATQRAMNISPKYSDEQYQLQRSFADLVKQALFGHRFRDEHGLGANLPYKTTSYVKDNGFEVQSGIAYEKVGPGEVGGLDEIPDPQNDGEPVLDFPNVRKNTDRSAEFYRLPVVNGGIVPIMTKNESQMDEAKAAIRAFFGRVTSLDHMEWDGKSSGSKEQSQNANDEQSDDSETDELPETLQALEPLLEVSGIGEATLRAIREWSLEQGESFEIDPDDLIDDRTYEDLTEKEIDEMSEAEMRAVMKRSL